MSFQPPTPFPPMPPPPGPPGERKETGTSGAALVVLLAGVALAAGSFLPWIEVNTIFGGISINGFSGDGKICAIAGAAVFVLIIATTNGRGIGLYGTVILAALIGGGTAVYDMINIQSKISGLQSGAATADIGIGLYLCAAGGVAAFVGSIAAQSALRK